MRHIADKSFFSFPSCPFSPLLQERERETRRDAERDAERDVERERRPEFDGQGTRDRSELERQDRHGQRRWARSDCEAADLGAAADKPSERRLKDLAQARGIGRGHAALCSTRREENHDGTHRPIKSLSTLFRG
jgi:hypothetical protein